LHHIYPNFISVVQEPHDDVVIEIDRQRITCISTSTCEMHSVFLPLEMHLVGCISNIHTDGTVEALAYFDDKFLTITLKISPDSASLTQATQITCPQLVEILQKSEELKSYGDKGKF